MAAAAKRKPVEEKVVEEAVPVSRACPVVTVGDAVAVVAFGWCECVLDVGQVHRLRRDLDRAFMELS